MYAQSYLTLCDPMNYIACHAPPSMGFFRQEYWGGLPLPITGDLLYQGIKCLSLGSPALQADSLTDEPLGKMGHDQSESDDMTTEQKGKKKRGEDDYFIYFKALTHLS